MKLIFLKNKSAEISTLLIMGFLVLIFAATLITTTLNKTPQDPRSEAAVNCNFDSGLNIPVGQTETNASNADARWPISSNRHEYDVFGNDYFSLEENNNSNILNLTYLDGGAVDSKVKNMMGSMFGYKPNNVKAFDMKYKKAPQGSDTDIKGNAPVLKVPTDSGADIKVPTTGYDIGGGYEAMVVFADTDRVTLHIGRHEYFVGTNNRSGGYWIYVKDICVDRQILNAYNNVKKAQEDAGVNLNPINLPMVRPGQVLGKSFSDGVTVGIRDNGPFISTSKPFYWEGSTDKNFSTPTTTATTATPSTSTPSTPTATGTPATTTPPTPATTGTTTTTTPTSTPTTPTSTPTATGTTTPTATSTPTSPTPVPTTTIFQADYVINTIGIVININNQVTFTTSVNPYE